MPVNLSIKNVPDALAERLRLRAESNHRSLQGELMAIIEGAATPAAKRQDRADSRVAGSSPGPGAVRGGKSIEQIGAEHRALYAEPFADLPRAVDIIRQDRDTR